MTKELEEAFADWWNSDYLLPDNPYKKDSKAYWAWEGYAAGILAERNRIINIGLHDFAGDACDFAEWLKS